MVNPAKASSNWYNASWSRRKAITITGSTAGAQTNYQVKITIPYVSSMQTNFNDIRFTSSDGTTLIDYWLESKTDSSTADFWVKVPSIPASPNTTTIYMYYGNSGVSSASNGENTFIVFDDFNNTKTRLFPYGSDGGQMSGFDPVSRRFYFFGADPNTGDAIKMTQWVNIDTNEVGFVYPSLPTALNGAAVIYHPTKKKFYIYGGRTASTVFSNKIYSFDPATETFATLPETLLESAIGMGAVLDPTSGKVYLFGGLTVYTPSTLSNTISVHNLDLETPTVTDTGANLAVASNGMEPIYATSNNKIYLFGGAYVASGSDVDSLDSIYSYNPSVPGTDPVDTGAHLAVEMDTPGTAYANGNVYIFGGYRYSEPVGYYNYIQKFAVSSESIATLAGTLYFPDDDMKAFYDSVNDRIYVGPVIHSTGSENEASRKVVILEFNPNTETLAPEPSLGEVPTGWTSVGTSTIDTPKVIGGSYMTIADHETDKYVRAQKTFSEITGVVMFESKVVIPSSEGSAQFTMKQDGGSIAAYLRSAGGTNWNIYNGSDHVIAAIPNGGYHIIGMLIDEPNEKQYGLVNRANKTAAYNWWNAGVTLNQIWINTSTAAREAILIDWVLVRKSTTGTEPSTSVGSETIYEAGSSSTSTSSTGTINPNCKTGFKYCINAGPGFSGLPSLIHGTDPLTGVIISSSVHHDDLMVSVDKPSLEGLSQAFIAYPWSQGLNTASEIYNFSAVSAFNGYPILSTDNPFIIQLAYDIGKLNGQDPTSLKIAYFDSDKGKWTFLSSPTVVDWVNRTIAATTKIFSLYAIVYPSSIGQTTNTLLNNPVLGTETENIVQTAAPKPVLNLAKPTTPPAKQKHCILWGLICL